MLVDIFCEFTDSHKAIITNSEHCLIQCPEICLLVIHSVDLKQYKFQNAFPYGESSVNLIIS